MYQTRYVAFLSVCLRGIPTKNGRIHNKKVTTKVIQLFNILTFRECYRFTMGVDAHEKFHVVPPGCPRHDSGAPLPNQPLDRGRGSFGSRQDGAGLDLSEFKHGRHRLRTAFAPPSHRVGVVKFGWQVRGLPSELFL